MKSLLIALSLILLTGCSTFSRKKSVSMPVPVRPEVVSTAPAPSYELVAPEMERKGPLTVQFDLIAPTELRTQLLPAISDSLRSVAQITENPRYLITILAAQRGNTVALSMAVIEPARFENLMPLLQSQHMSDYQTWLEHQKFGRLVFQDVKLISASPTETTRAIVELVHNLNDLR